MMDALKKERMKGAGPTPMSEMGGMMAKAPAEGVDLVAMVEALGPEERMKLKSLLMESEEAEGQLAEAEDDVLKGAASEEEEAAINDELDVADIASDISSPQGEAMLAGERKPRNLSERMEMQFAKMAKGKKA